MQNWVWWTFGIFAVAIIIAYVLSPTTIEEQKGDFFVASLGCLAFLSIFYGFTSSYGSDILEKVKEIYALKKEEVRHSLKKAIASDGATLTHEVKRNLEKWDSYETATNYLDLNYYVCIGALSFLMSIASYFFKSGGFGLVLQIITFWLGFIMNIVLVIVWYMANKEYSENFRKSSQRTPAPEDSGPEKQS